MKFDREREAHSRLFSYAAYKRTVSDYEYAAVRIAKPIDLSGVRGSSVPDPAGRGGAMLAEPPKQVRAKAGWCAAIEDAWDECRAEDETSDRADRGLAYAMEKYFCLTGGRRCKDDNQKMRELLQAECGISSRTLYVWIEQITDSVIYHAAKRNLL